MPSPKTQTLESGADAASARADDGRSRAGTQRLGATDGITITRWSLGLSLTIALTVVTAAFTLVWNQTVRLGETQLQLVARVTGLDERTMGLDTRITSLESEMRDLRAEVGDLRVEVGDLRVEVREEVGGLREEIRELADFIRERDLPDPPVQ